MRAARFGRIVLISSRAALGLATRTSYSATKAAMIGMARTWALELGPDGITVNCVAPGPIGGTEIFHEVLPPGDARIERLAASIPVRRLGTPQDVARAVRFLADPEPASSPGRRCSFAAAAASAVSHSDPACAGTSRQFRFSRNCGAWRMASSRRSFLALSAGALAAPAIARAAEGCGDDRLAERRAELGSEPALRAGRAGYF